MSSSLLSCDPVMDPRECLEGISKAYFCGSNMDEADIDNENSDSDDQTLDSIKKVEGDLMVLIQKDDSLDPEKARDRANRACVQDAPNEMPKPSSTTHSRHAFPCSDTSKVLPSNPSQWPQAPLMIRPTPHTSTKIRGIRRANSLDYEHFVGFCEGCILPINNGNEEHGQSLVIDFESNHFIGTLLLRIKQAKSNIVGTSYRETSYFDGKKRKFQAVVKGQFKTELPMSETFTGQSFQRPAGKLPAKWIVKSFIKVISTLAPQLEVDLDGDSPRFLSPLVATAHTVQQQWPKSLVVDAMSTDMENELEEPPSTDPSSLLPSARQALGITKGTNTTTSSSLSARMSARKKVFNTLAAKKETSLKFQTDREYSFEFYQHLLDFGDDALAVDMGRPIGKVGLASATDGQPLKFMSAHKDPTTGELDTLWSFDIWHSSLYPLAVLAHSENTSK